MRRLLPLALALALGGCSLLPMESDPFDASVAVHSWQLEGKMTFRCDYDEQGFFWRFVSQSGTLTNENRETVATLSGNLKLAHRDGSSVSAHVEKSLSPATSRNAGDVRYLVDRGRRLGRPAGRTLPHPHPHDGRHAACVLFGLAAGHHASHSLLRALHRLPLTSPRRNVLRELQIW